MNFTFAFHPLGALVYSRLVFLCVASPNTVGATHSDTKNNRKKKPNKMKNVTVFGYAHQKCVLLN